MGFAAAIKTIDLIVKNIPKFLMHQGSYIEKNGMRYQLELKIKIETNNFKPLITFKFLDFDDTDLVSTYFTQEMLKEGFLKLQTVFICLIPHKIFN